MNLTQHEDVLYSLTEIHPNDLNVIQAALKAFIQLAESTNLDTLTDEQEKKVRIDRLKSVLRVLMSVPNTKTAESWDETIFRKIIEKYVDAD